jgi:hypothetical protein
MVLLALKSEHECKSMNVAPARYSLPHLVPNDFTSPVFRISVLVPGFSISHAFRELRCKYRASKNPGTNNEVLTTELLNTHGANAEVL